MAKYIQGTKDPWYVKRYGKPQWTISGKLRRTSKKVKPVRSPIRAVHVDEKGQLWFKASNKWWKYPEEGEF